VEITKIGFHFHSISLKQFKKDTNEKGRGRDGVVEMLWISPEKAEKSTTFPKKGYGTITGIFAAKKKNT